MNCTLSKVVMFTVGAAVGSAVTYKYLKTKYERIADDEIESIREFYEKRRVEIPKNETTGDTEEIKKTYNEIADGYGSTVMPDDANEEVTCVSKPYVISPSEFGENDYETESLTYYADGVLADETNEVIEDVDDIVGEASLETFGQYEDDSVFVRNDRLERDYEILYDSRSYSQVKKLYSQRAED